MSAAARLPSEPLSLVNGNRGHKTSRILHDDFAVVGPDCDPAPNLACNRDAIGTSVTSPSPTFRLSSVDTRHLCRHPWERMLVDMGHPEAAARNRPARPLRRYRIASSGSRSARGASGCRRRALPACLHENVLYVILEEVVMPYRTARFGSLRPAKRGWCRNRSGVPANGRAFGARRSMVPNNGVNEERGLPNEEEEVMPSGDVSGRGRRISAPGRIRGLGGTVPGT